MADFILVLVAVVLAVESTTLLFSKSSLMRTSERSSSASAKRIRLSL